MAVLYSGFLVDFPIKLRGLTVFLFGMGILKMSNRARWKSVGILATVLILVMAGICLQVGKSGERQEFAGQAVSGYRIRCTLAKDWKLVQEPHGPGGGALEHYRFTTSSVSAWDWIRVHVFHQPFYADLEPDRPTLSITAIVSDVAHIRTPSGYPELFGGSRKHLQVDNRPATLSNYDVTGLDVNVGHYTNLLFCTPDQKITYIMTITAPEQYNNQRNQAMILQNDREMQAILSSIHLDKPTQTD